MQRLICDFIFLISLRQVVASKNGVITTVSTEISSFNECQKVSFFLSFSILEHSFQ